MDDLSAGAHAITFENIYEGYNVYAIDNITKKVTRLVEGTTVAFEIEEGDLKRVSPFTLSFKKKNACIVSSDNDLFNVLVSLENIEITSINERKQDVLVNVFNTVGSHVVQQGRMNSKYSNVIIKTN